MQYRYAGSAELDAKWKEWLNKPTTVARMRRFYRSGGGDEGSASPGRQQAGRIGPGGSLRQLKPVGFADFGYDNLQSK